MTGEPMRVLLFLFLSFRTPVGPGNVDRGLLLRMCTLLYDDFVKCCKKSWQNEDYQQDS